jgi:hypothetical protein
MRKGLIGPFQLGALEAVSETLRIAHKVTGERGCDLEGLFFATALQAGIDRFLLPALDQSDIPKSEFVSARTTYIERQQSEPHWNAVHGIFSRYLPNNWEREDKFHNVWPWSSFLSDLFCAMQRGASLLAVWGIPQSSILKDLVPTELFSTILTLANCFQNIEISTVVPASEVSRENIEQFRIVMLSDVFSGYVMAQETLENEGITTDSSVARGHKGRPRSRQVEPTNSYHTPKRGGNLVIYPKTD